LAGYNSINYNSVCKDNGYWMLIVRKTFGAGGQ